MRTFLFFVFNLVIVQALFSQTGTIIFYRCDTIGKSITSVEDIYTIMEQTNTIGIIKKNSELKYKTFEGKHFFYVENFQSSTTIQIDIQNSKDYYIELKVKKGDWGLLPVLIVTNRQNYLSAIKQQAKEIKKEIIIEAQRIEARKKQIQKNIIGAAFQGGPGFSSIDMGATSDFKTFSVMFGGGAGLNLMYNRVLSNRFEIMTTYNYHISSLTPKANNANVSVSKHSFAITPMLVLGRTSNESFAFKIGVGLEYYFKTSMSLDLPSLSTSNSPFSGTPVQYTPAINDTWQYKSAIGWHSQFLVDQYFSDNVFFTFGIQLKFVQFQFSQGGYTYPTESKLTQPNGGMLNFILGVAYKF